MRTTYTYSQALTMIRIQMDEEGSQRQYACRMGVSEAFISSVMRGKQKMSKRMLEDIGLREVKCYEKQDKRDGEYL